MFVGAQDVFASGKGGDQHEQSGLGQVEIGQHRIDCFEFEVFEFGTWTNKEVGCRRACDDGS